jgi:hypothetical protein
MILVPGALTGLVGLLISASSQDGFLIGLLGFALLVVGVIVGVVILDNANKEGQA